MTEEEKKSFWCEGCGEPRYKCYCDNVCEFCGKLEKDCIAESDSGYCPLDPDLDKRLAMQKAIKESINKKK